MASTTNKSTPKRDASGKFTAGCAPGPGRPSRPSASKSYVERARLECGPEELALVIRRLLRQSQAGSVRASELLLRWFLPMVGPIDESRLDTDALTDDGEFRIAGQERIGVFLDNLKLFVERAREVDRQCKASGNPSPYDTNSQPSLPLNQEPQE